MANMVKGISIVFMCCDKDYDKMDSFVQNIERCVKIPYQLVCIDNSSETHTSEFDIIDVYYSAGKNLGMLQGRKKGFEFCKYDWIWFIDIDDYVKTVDSDLLNLINKNIGDKTQILEFRTLNSNSNHKHINGIDFDYDVTVDTKLNFAFWSRFYKKECLKKVYDYIYETVGDVFINFGEDYLFVKLFYSINDTKADNIVNINKVIYKYNVSESSFQMQSLEKFKRVIKGLKNHNDLVYKYYGNINDCYYNIINMVDTIKAYNYGKEGFDVLICEVGLNDFIDSLYYPFTTEFMKLKKYNGFLDYVIRTAFNVCVESKTENERLLKYFKLLEKLKEKNKSKL